MAKRKNMRSGSNKAKGGRNWGEPKKKHASRKRKSSSAKGRGRVVARPKFAGKQYECDGKRVRVGTSRTKKAPRVFCHRVA